MFNLFVKSTESDEVLLIVKVDGVLDVLPVLRVFGVCVPVVTHLGRSLETHFSFFLLQIKQNTHANTLCILLKSSQAKLMCGQNCELKLFLELKKLER